MGIVHDAVKAVGRAMQNVNAGEEKLVSRTLAAADRATPPRLHVTSPAFAANGPLPLTSTVDGDGAPPPLTWTGVPAEAKSIVVICEDPDAPLPEPFVHWIVYGAAPTLHSLDIKASYREGKNSKLGNGFTPAAPPLGHGVHAYHFQVFALDVPSDFEAGLGRSALVEKMKRHVLAWGEIVGTYERK